MLLTENTQVIHNPKKGLAIPSRIKYSLRPMKRKTYGAGGAKIVKTSISLPDVLMEFSEQRCKEEGFNSFSSYVAHLVRLDKEKHASASQQDTISKGKASSSSPVSTPADSPSKVPDPVAEIVKRHHPGPGAPRRK